jgi:hypothetical protein
VTMKSMLQSGDNRVTLDFDAMELPSDRLNRHLTLRVSASPLVPFLSLPSLHKMTAPSSQH